MHPSYGGEAMNNPNTLPANGGVSDARVDYLLNNREELTRFVKAAEENADDYLALNRRFAEYREAHPPSVQGGERVENATTELFARVGAAIATQDNRATDAPIFIVQQKRSYVTEEGYNDSRYEWRETESGDYSGPDDEELARLDNFYSNEGHEPKGWKRFAIMDVWEFVTACFTEQGCKDYIAINGHNLKEPRIYAGGSYRNEEFRAIRKALIEFAPPPAGGGKEALSDAERLASGALKVEAISLSPEQRTTLTSSATHIPRGK